MWTVLWNIRYTTEKPLVLRASCWDWSRIRSGTFYCGTCYGFLRLVCSADQLNIIACYLNIIFAPPFAPIETRIFTLMN